MSTFVIHNKGDAEIYNVVDVCITESGMHYIDIERHGSTMYRLLTADELPDELKYKLAILKTSPSSFGYYDADNDIGWSQGDVTNTYDGSLNNYNFCMGFYVMVSNETLAELTGEETLDDNTGRKGEEQGEEGS
jgi:hypothetical protein